MDTLNGKTVSGMKSSCSALPPCGTPHAYTQLLSKMLDSPIIHPVLVLLYNLLFWLNFYLKVQWKSSVENQILKHFTSLSLLFLCLHSSRSSKWLPNICYSYLCVIPSYIVWGLVYVANSIWWKWRCVISERKEDGSHDVFYRQPSEDHPGGNFMGHPELNLTFSWLSPKLLTHWNYDSM